MNLPPIQIVDSKEKLLEISKFRYQIYIGELGDTYDGVDDNEGMLQDELDEFGVTMYAEENGRLLGTCRINFGCHGPFDEYWDECYDLSAFPKHEHLSLASKMMIVPEHRGSMLSFAFLTKAIELCKKYQAHFMFLDCIPPLVPLYEIAGFKRYKKNSPENKNLKYYIPMVGCFEDYDYLKKIASPYFEILKDYPADLAVAEWFNKAFPPKIGYTKESLIPYPSLLQFVEERVPLSSVTLLKDFTAEEIKEFLQSATITYCSKGETITFKKDSGREMYLLLEGKVEIRKRDKQETSAVLTINPGEVFGAYNYLLQGHRQVDSFAQNDLTVLIINQSFRKNALAAHPKMAAKFFYNLGKIIAQRNLIHVPKTQ